MDVQATRELICKIGRLLYQRNLTDLSGGSISAQAGKYICMVPAQAGIEWLWDLDPKQVLVIDQQGIKVDGIGDFPDDYKIHFHLYREIPNGSAVISCRAPSVSVFAAAGIPITPVLESAADLGEIGFCESLPIESPEFSLSLVTEIRKKKQALATSAAAIMSPNLGLIVYGRSLTSAFDAVERIEANARTILMSTLLRDLDQTSLSQGKRVAEFVESTKKVRSEQE